MKENKWNDRRDDERENEDDQLRPNTTNETIREVSGDIDGSSGNRSDRDRLSDTYDERSGAIQDDSIDRTQGVSYTPNDSSGVRSGGFVDMDDQAAGGAGLSDDGRLGSGSNIKIKKNVTGSDFDGQNSTS